MRTIWLTGFLAAATFLAGCELSDDDDASGAYWSSVAGEDGGGGETGESPSGSTGGGFSLGNVVWLHGNVGGWEQTASLSSVRVSGGSITLNYNKANVWPAVNGMNANPWIFVQRDGRWYGATWEWLRKGQTTKSVAAVRGDHIKRAPLNNFVPASGETYGFMVSGLIRDKTRNVSERSNVVMMRWP